MVKVIDCTLRDGGYYNNWDFSIDLIEEYLNAMSAAAIDFVELGFRSFDKSSGFMGSCAYTSDNFIRSLRIPAGLKIGVMMNAAELFKQGVSAVDAAKMLFVPAAESPVSIVRFACHIHEFENTLPVCAWLKEVGYTVGINLMQIADRSEAEIEGIAKVASQYPLDVLYFADSMGSMDPEQTAQIVRTLRKHWKGALGVHTHDNMGKAVANSVRAVEEGVTWVDSTVTGMGRGPGNAQTEYVVVELEKQRGQRINVTPLLELIRRHFQPMKEHYGWGINTYYYLAGKYGIHPTYIQEMLGDSRYSEVDILAAIEHLKLVGGKKFSLSTLESARQFFSGEPRGTWSPQDEIEGRNVLILGTGPSVAAHRLAIEQFIREHKPFVIALNTQKSLEESLIDMRAACHPVRLLADCDEHLTLPQPLATPFSMLPEPIREKLSAKKVLDFGLNVEPGKFAFQEQSATLPTSLVVAYTLAIATSGKANGILLAGFDGYGADDPRNAEMDTLLDEYRSSEGAKALVCITPTRYHVKQVSVYANQWAM
ncbi:aldolase catalytic domain-containing protein [Massilia sp.]|uniref:aldolase catalytic domain-containing protein n=1 Tax=Massilia sp. TaxID=1882437 RepID=UPI00289CC002|nr:aldolase catalytic domain-containing protein [Massilia sp.]